MLGIILAGGHGTRLFPSTRLTSKHLLPVAGKPMIYYSITTLIYLGCRELIILCASRDKQAYERLFDSIGVLNINLYFVVQDDPIGIPDAITQTQHLRKNREAIVILGDNIFVGNEFNRLNFSQSSDDFAIVTKKVNNPQDFGVLIEGSDGLSFEEKPKTFKSSNAILGLYKIPRDVDQKISKQVRSYRGELEIMDTIAQYNDEKRLSVNSLGRAIYWCDAGRYDRIEEADQFISVLEKSSIGLIGSPEEAAFNSNLISLNQFESIIFGMPSCTYREKLEQLLMEYRK